MLNFARPSQWAPTERHEIAAAQEVGIRRAPRSIVEYTEPPRRVPWLACALGAVLFAVGYFVGRVLP